MSPTHRTPRAHLSSKPVSEEPSSLPPVSPALVEWLEGAFPITLSPRFTSEEGIQTAIDQAEQRGRQQVIDRLRSISQNQE